MKKCLQQTDVYKDSVPCNQQDNALQWRVGGLAHGPTSGTRWQWQGPFRNGGAGAEVLFLNPEGVLMMPPRQRRPDLSEDLLPSEQLLKAELASVARVTAKSALSKQSTREKMKTNAGACLYFRPSYFLSCFIYLWLTSRLPHGLPCIYLYVYLMLTCYRTSFTSCLPPFAYLPFRRQG